MSAPKPATILLILALVALVALFVVGVVLGADDTRRPPSPEERAKLGERLLGSAPPVTAGELSFAGGCGGTTLKPTIAAKGTCRLQIAAGKSSRALVVRTRDRMHLVFTPNGEPRVPIDVTLKLGKDNKADLSVSKDGAVLALTCEQPEDSSKPCRVTLE